MRAFGVLRTLLVVLSVSSAAILATPAMADTTKAHPYNKGCEQLEKGNLARAEKAFESALELNATDTDAMNNLAVVYILQERYEEALELLQEVLGVNPEYRGADLNIGGGYILQTYWDDALLPTERASKASKGSSAKELRAMAHHNLGLIAAAAGDLDEALTWFSEAGGGEEAEICIATLLCMSGETEQGIERLEEIQGRGLDEDVMARVTHNIAIAYYRHGLSAMEGGRLEDALREFDRSSELRGNVYADFGRALLSAESGDLEVAYAALSEIAESGAPGDVRAAAEENMGLVADLADRRSAWIKWLTLPTILLPISASVLALRSLAGTPQWAAKRKTLRVIVGVVGGLVATMMLVVTWFDPFRTVQWLGGWGLAAMALAGWVHLGSSARGASARGIRGAA